MKFFFLFLSFFVTLGAEDWSHDYAATLAQAQKENKKVYMLITSEHCRWCRKFENTTLQEEMVIAKLKNNYLLLHVDRNFDTFPEKFTRQGVPRHYVLAKNEEVIYTSFGYMTSEEFFEFLEEVEKRYARMSQK
jgi:thioredoxin-related protein